MADRRPAGEREYNPLDDSRDLISRVVTGKGAAPAEPQTPQKEEVIRVTEKIVELKKTSNVFHQPKDTEDQKEVEREEYVILKFNVPRSDFVAAKRIVSMLEEELH